MRNLLHRYIFWTEDRGSLHFDVLVTAILIFIFFSPRLIDFKDRPVETVALQSSEVLVKEAGNQNGRPRFIYQVRSDNLGAATSKPEIDTAILRLVEPISGEVTLDHWEPIRDASGHIVAYDAYVLR